MFKQIIKYFLILMAGTFFAGLLLYSQASKNLSILKAYTDKYPKIMTSHIPIYKSLFGLEFSHIGHTNKNIGAGYIKVQVVNNEKARKYIKNLQLDSKSIDIDINEVFNITLDRTAVSELNHIAIGSSLTYPFPYFYNDSTYRNFELIYYEYGKGIYSRDKEMPENPKLNDEWKHGFSKGIALNKKEDKFLFWLKVW